MISVKLLDLTPANIAQYGICGYKDVNKHTELRKKIDWFTEYYPKGLRIKIIIHPAGGYQGMIEYIPGKYAHRPVDAEGFMFIHCIFCGFKNEYKNKGYGKKLLEACINEAKNENMHGVAVVTRKGSFMADSSLFLKRGFLLTDKAAPDFELLVLKFDDNHKFPVFTLHKAPLPEEFSEGITVLRSPQCPYTEKNVNAILEHAQSLGL
ncbi:MAG: GNAT family N-acetyltransferase, partial [Ignavibacteriales bacterium]|nr:GNAT family N-acetyltransferase [Ignavibacteriales bacterium]